MQSRINTISWLLYDFANSLVQIVFVIYFAQWMVIEQGIPDLVYNIAFMVSAFLLLCTVPFVGAMLDAGKFRRITGLRITSLAMVGWYGASAAAALVGMPLVALICFALALYSFLLSFTFYTPFLAELAPEGKRGRLSGFGIAAHYAGQIVALVAVLPLATGGIAFFGASPRAETLLPSVLAFAVFALPMLLGFRELPRTQAQPAHTKKELALLASVPGVFFFLIAYFFANDAILTAANNFSIFLEVVWQMPDTTKTLVLLGIFVSSAIGGIGAGMLADRWGHKRTLTVVFAGWLIIFPLLAFTTHPTLFFVLTTVLGFWFGSHWSVSRSVMAYLAPVAQRNLAFGLFSVVERVSSLVGPLVWGLVVSGFVLHEPTNYRIAMFTMTLFVVASLLALWRVPSDTHMRS